MLLLIKKMGVIMLNVPKNDWPDFNEHNFKLYTFSKNFVEKGNLLMWLKKALSKSTGEEGVALPTRRPDLNFRYHFFSCSYLSNVRRSAGQGYFYFHLYIDHYSSKGPLTS